MGDKSIRNDKVKKKKKSVLTSVVAPMISTVEMQKQPELIRKKKKDR